LEKSVRVYRSLFQNRAERAFGHIPSEPTHLRGHDDRIVVPIRGRGKRDLAFPFTACINQLPGNVTRDIEGLRNRPPLCHQAR
jgi:hypothetical protein